MKKKPVKEKDLIYFFNCETLGQQKTSGIITYITDFTQCADVVHFTARIRIIVESEETEATITYNAVTEETRISGIFLGSWWWRALVTSVVAL